MHSSSLAMPTSREPRTLPTNPPAKAGHGRNSQRSGQVRELHTALCTYLADPRHRNIRAVRGEGDTHGVPAVQPQRQCEQSEHELHVIGLGRVERSFPRGLPPIVRVTLALDPPLRVLVHLRFLTQKWSGTRSLTPYVRAQSQSCFSDTLGLWRARPERAHCLPQC